MNRGRARQLWGIAGLAAVYVVVARLGLMMDAVSGFATLVWPPTGIALVALLLFGIRLWPGVAVGALLVNAWVGAPLLVAAGIATGNTLEAVLGAWALQRIGFRTTLARLRDVIALILLGAVASTAVSATIGVASLWLGGIVSAANIAETWRAWWVGDMMGDLIVAPLLLSLTVVRPLFRRADRSPAEAAIIVVLLVAVSSLIFSDWLVPNGGAFRQVYLIFPMLIWASVRFEQVGAAVSVFLVAIVAVAATSLGAGPFVHAQLSESLLYLEVFLAAVATTMLVLGGVTAERRQAIETRDDFLAVVSHDLKDPLSSVEMAAGVMLEDMLGRLPAEVREQVLVVQRAARRALNLIRDLVDLAAVKSGRFPITAQQHDAGALVRDAADTIRPLAARASLTLRTELPDEPIPLWCDHDRIVQVLTNLIGNSIKFTPAGGTVTIRVQPQGAVVRFAVQDTGQGIDEQHLPHLFKEYWQARPGRAGGLGLGLAIAKGIVSAHGGQIGAESRVGAGSTFYFTLPKRVS